MKRFRNTTAWLLLIGLWSCQDSEQLKYEQYFAEGYTLYTTHCANCHQADGAGLADLYPPINRAALALDRSRFICVVKHGVADTLWIDGKRYARPMPANPRLNDIEIAEITTYVLGKWAGDSTYTSIETVTQALVVCQKP